MLILTEVHSLQKGPLLVLCILRVWTNVMTCVYDYSTIHSSFTALKLSVFHLFTPPHPTLNPWQPLVFLFCL